MPAVVQTITQLALMLTDPKVIMKLITAAFRLMAALADGFEKSMDVLLAAVPDIIINLGKAFIKNAPRLIRMGINMITTIAKAFLSGVGLLLKHGKTIFTRLSAAFKNFNWAKLGRDIINGIKNGLEEQKAKLYAKIREIANMLPDAVKKLLKIGSPSKVMADLYQWVPLGGVQGLQKTAPKLYQEMRNIVGNVTRMGTGSFDLAANVSGNGYGTDRNGAIVNQTINVGQMSSYKEAYMIKRATQQGMRRVMAGAALNE
jgi:hypothetical protein